MLRHFKSMIKDRVTDLGLNNGEQTYEITNLFVTKFQSRKKAVIIFVEKLNHAFNQFKASNSNTNLFERKNQKTMPVIS